MKRFFLISLVIVCFATGFVIWMGQPRQEVKIRFEGPWAFAADPGDATHIYAIAPKTATHASLTIAGQPVGSGIYEVSLNAPSVRRRGAAIDQNILQAEISAEGVRHALFDSGNRYAIRLPRPKAYLPVRSGLIRAGSSYPPGPTTEKNYAMSVELVYRVHSVADFAVTGRPDEGVFNPVLVNGSNLDLAIRPQMATMDECELHNREAFRDLARLVLLKMYVDFGKFGDECHVGDPQLP
jgi:hypothetical protein